MGGTKIAYPGVEERAAMGPASQDRSPLGLGDEGIRSLEVRWIFAGPLPAAMTGWIGRFPAQTTTLEDTYLVDPHLAGLSVKVREGRALEVKMHHGSPGLLEVPKRARGRIESWQKWSFPHEPVGRGGSDQAGWRTVRKRRRISRFPQVGGRAVVPAPRLGEEPGCAVEIAEFRATGEDWWTLGFEATGPDPALRGQLEAAAALVFDRALPGQVELDMNDCMSYAQWLRR